MQETSTQRSSRIRRLQIRTSSDSLEGHGAFHKTGSAEAHRRNRGDVQFGPHVISQLAKHVDPFDPPQNTVRYLGGTPQCDPGVVAGRFDVRGETAAGRNPD
ncbi:hypothetical protein TcBrA4_0052470 [Trypanosoma cruzi]|nr:hypothetical protein TcBrA4_0052470 [Trypanosoma cruzi]